MKNKILVSIVTIISILFLQGCNSNNITLSKEQVDELEALNRYYAVLETFQIAHETINSEIEHRSEIIIAAEAMNANIYNAISDSDKKCADSFELAKEQSESFKKKYPDVKGKELDELINVYDNILTDMQNSTSRLVYFNNSVDAITAITTDGNKLGKDRTKITESLYKEKANVLKRNLELMGRFENKDNN